MGFIIDMLKEVPLSAVIREKLVDAEKRLSVLEEDNNKLRIILDQKNHEIDRLNKIINSLKETQSIKKLDDREYRVLKFFYDIDQKITIEKIAQSLDLEIQIVKHHIKKLSNLKYLELSSVGANWITKEPDKYQITPQGRAYIIENHI